ncbi:hypothetical protein EB809_09470 [Marinobacter sp. R17]|nr:hypothetical protein EB809_09470 [Marinobacter sp. R17]
MVERFRESRVHVHAIAFQIYGIKLAGSGIPEQQLLGAAVAILASLSMLLTSLGLAIETTTKAMCMYRLLRSKRAHWRNRSKPEL